MIEAYLRANNMFVDYNEVIPARLYVLYFKPILSSWMELTTNNII